MSTLKKERPPVVTFSEDAIDRLEEMMEDAPENTVGIILGLKNAGCAGVSYVMDYATEAPALSETVKAGSVDLIIELKSLLFLLGTHIDYKTEKLKAGFIFNNPNQTDACGCGESVKLEAAPQK